MDTASVDGDEQLDDDALERLVLEAIEALTNGWPDRMTEPWPPAHIGATTPS